MKCIGCKLRDNVEKRAEPNFKTQTNKEFIHQLEENKEDSKFEICEQNKGIEELVAPCGFVEKCSLNLEDDKTLKRTIFGQVVVVCWLMPNVFHI